MNLFLWNVADMADPKEHEELLAGVPEWRREKILRYLLPSDRKLSLGAWRLLEKALELNGLAASDVTIGQNGKLQCGKLHFNLSHSVDMALCVVSDVPVGCDIEKVKKAPNEVAEHTFTANERKYLAAGCDEAECNHRFFKVWTIKESYLKMTGEGIQLPLTRVEIDFDTMSILRDGQVQPCAVQNFSLGEYEISICEWK